MSSFASRILIVAANILSGFGALRDLVVSKTTNLKADRLALVRGIAVCFAITFLIGVFGWNLRSVPHPPDLGHSFYVWILPEPTFTTRATVWTLYLSHQILHLATVHNVLKSKIRYSSTLRPVHYWMMGLNIFFIFAHFIQSHTTYDGLAQDLPLFPALGLAGFMLTWILLMENHRRGLCFQYPLPCFSKELITFTRKFHPYYFSVAIVAVFWFHPLENTLGHLTGVFYNLLLLLQSCLFLTPIHKNHYWTFTLEFFVIIHSTVVGFFDSTKSWPLYFFWFITVFAVTQMHGLNLSFHFQVAVIVLLVVSCKEMFHKKGVEFIWDLLFGPTVEYSTVFIIAAILWAIKTCLKIKSCLRSSE